MIKIIIINVNVDKFSVKIFSIFSSISIVLFITEYPISLIST